MVDVSPAQPAPRSDLELEADRTTWLEYFKLALEGAAGCDTQTPQKLVMRAELIASAAVAALAKRGGTAG